MAYYLDTSALVKLVVADQETSALLAWMTTGHAALVSSDLARAELVRAVRRSMPDALVQARAVLDSLTLLALTTAVLEDSGRLGEVSLRTLDAVHLAAALTLGDDLDALVTYDERLDAAARALGVAVLAPR